MNVPRIRSGFRLLLRSLTLIFQEKENRTLRVKQAVLCLKAIGQGILGHKVPQGTRHE